MSITRQTEALLALVETDRAHRCEAILGEARGQVQALLADAHADARRRMREAFAEERVRHDERVAAARANLQTRRRAASQRRAAALLAAGWRELPAALAARWRVPESRRAWVASVAASARALLPAAGWRVSHPHDWSAAERAALFAELATPPEFVADPNIRAGLRISADGNAIDSTEAGLLADRAAIGGELLRLLEVE